MGTRGRPPAPSAGWAIAVPVALLLDGGGTVASAAGSLEAGYLSVAEEGRLEESVAQLGFRFSDVEPGGPILDFALTSFPTLLGQGFFLAISDLDLGFVVPLGGESGLVPRIGVSALAGAGADAGAGAIGGWNAGAGLFTRVNPSLGVRFDYSYRRFLEADSDSDESFNSLTIGLVWMPAGRKGEETQQ